jgi:hypothetical protein
MQIDIERAWRARLAFKFVVSLLGMLGFAVLLLVRAPS